MEELEAWLRAAGLADHAAAFRTHRVALEQLRALTDADLREIGLPVGDRLRFQDALARREATPLGAQVGPERRPLTVVFLDLVDSTGLAARIEAEDLLETLNMYRGACAEPIQRYGGQVAQFLGDGVMTYFGYPAAHEDDPERAVRASLEAVAAVSRLAAADGTPLAARAGVATGVVLAGDLFGVGAAAPERGGRALGNTPNLAARLQTLARPGSVVVAAETAAKLGGLFRLERLPEAPLRGLAAPVRAFRVLGERASGLRRRARGQRSAFVNRAPELAALHARWAEALAGYGGTVLLRGEAGIGKSRLVQHFVAQRADRDASTAVTIQASPFHRDDPLRPFAVALRTQLRARPPAAAEPGGGVARSGGALNRLKGLLEGGEEDEARLAAVADLIGVAGPREAVLLRGAPPARLRALTLDALAELAASSARRRPILLVIEDAHWLDPTSLALAARVAAEACGHSMLVVLTARDGFTPPPGSPWDREDFGAKIDLLGLTEAEASRLLRDLCGCDSPPAEARDLALHSGGVPLFIEEVARALAERATHGGDSRVNDAAPPAVPATLREGLAARLDSAGSVGKALAQAAAVLGTEGLRPEQLAAVTGRPAMEVADGLARLEAAGVLRHREAGDGGGPNGDAEGTVWTFRHALLREAAYESLPRDRRRALHGRAAEALLSIAAESEPALLARHLLEAGKADEAMPHLVAAARRSLARCALEEAARLLRRGLAGLAALPDSAGARERRLELMALLGPALVGLRGAGSDKVQALYAEAVELTRTLPPRPEHFPLLFGWWRLALARDFRESGTRAAALRTFARDRHDRDLMLQAHHCGWPARFHLGDLCGCERHVRAGLRLYDPERHRAHASLYGNHDAKVCGLAHAALSLWQRGATGAALRQMAEALAWARRFGHVGSVLHAREIGATLRVFGRDHGRVEAAVARLDALAEAHGFDDQRARSRVLRGWVAAARGEARAGAALAAEGLEAVSTAEDFPVFHCLLAEAQAAAGEPEAAAARLSAAREDFRRTGLRFWMPEILRTHGELRLQADAGAVDAAMADFDAGWREAEAQGAHRLALRSALAACRLARREGGAADAERVLARLRAARVRVAAAGGDRDDIRAADALLAALPRSRPGANSGGVDGRLAPPGIEPPLNPLEAGP
ncbi:MAG: AAA family ATPase [Acetobacteraceae bacterium]|nr:AAA family ATPase [Acetobacteraceae bacterium]